MINGNGLFRYAAPRFGRVPFHFMGTSVLLSMLKSQILIGKINEKKGKTIRIYELVEQTIKGSNGSLPGWASHQDWIPFNQIQVLRHKI